MSKPAFPAIQAAHSTARSLRLILQLTRTRAPSRWRRNSDRNAPQLKINADVEASVPGYPGRTFHGTVTSINPTVDSNSRTVSVEAKFRSERAAVENQRRCRSQRSRLSRPHIPRHGHFD